MSLVVTCLQCLEIVLEADRIGDDEECVLRDHLLAVHPTTVQPETLAVLLKHFVVTEEPPPAAEVSRCIEGQTPEASSSQGVAQ